MAIWRGAGCLVLAVAIAGCDFAPATDKAREAQEIPSPEEALQQAEKLSPRQIAQIEVDASIRDRLRSDPQWQEIATAIRADIINMKFGDGLPAEPAWQKYGAKAFPLFDYYSRSRDYYRQLYGMVGIRKLGKPYTTLWLERHVQRRAITPNFELITQDVNYLLTQKGKFRSFDSKEWEAEFGLDDPAIRQEIVQLAQANLNKRQPSRLGASLDRYYAQFNYDLLVRLLGYEAVEGQPTQLTKNLAGLKEWEQWENTGNITKAIAEFKKLPQDAQTQVLVERYGSMRAGEISDFARRFYVALSRDSDAFLQIWAIAELDRHNDPRASQELQTILNANMARLYPLSQLVSYENRFDDRGAFAYFLLLGMVEKYPNSKYAKGCRAYGDLTGYSYFGGEERPESLRRQLAQKTAKQKEQDWRKWLAEYAGHPGSDDARYLLARSLQDQNKVIQALAIWMELMSAPAGDTDAAYLAWAHIRTILDVGLSVPELAKLAGEPSAKPFQPLIQYAIAVHQARRHNYRQALDTLAKIDFSQLSDAMLNRYYGLDDWSWVGFPMVEIFRKDLLATVEQQKQRWEQLDKWQEEITPDTKYKIASDWAGQGGWINGYLPIWDGFRLYHLPTGSWDVVASCQEWWVCDPMRRSPSAMRQSYQESSQLATALALYQELLDDPATPANLREKSLYMSAMLLLEQWEDHDYGETVRIHPPARVIDTTQPNMDWQVRENTIKADYLRRIQEITQELQSQFPNSPYIDDLLFSSFFLSENPKFLQQIVQQYPNGDRFIEAKFVLSRQK